MTELIDKNAMLDRLKKAYEENKEYSVANGLAMAYDMVQGQPTVEAKPIHHSTRTDENGVKLVFGEHGWERKEE